MRVIGLYKTAYQRKFQGLAALHIGISLILGGLLWICYAHPKHERDVPSIPGIVVIIVGCLACYVALFIMISSVTLSDTDPDISLYIPIVSDSFPTRHISGTDLVEAGIRSNHSFPRPLNVEDLMQCSVHKKIHPSSHSINREAIHVVASSDLNEKLPEKVGVHCCETTRQLAIEDNSKR